VHIVYEYICIFYEEFMQCVKVGEKVSGLSMNFHDILYSKKCNAYELIDSRCLQLEIFTHKVSCQCVIINTHEFNCKQNCC
jgi:hypothetical protein